MSNHKYIIVRELEEDLGGEREFIGETNDEAHAKDMAIDLIEKWHPLDVIRVYKLVSTFTGDVTVNEEEA